MGNFPTFIIFIWATLVCDVTSPVKSLICPTVLNYNVHKVDMLKPHKHTRFYTYHPPRMNPLKALAATLMPPTLRDASKSWVRSCPVEAIKTEPAYTSLDPIGMGIVVVPSLPSNCESCSPPFWGVAACRIL